MFRPVRRDDVQLSARERDILWLCLEGLRPKEIASRLGIGARAVNVRLRRIQSKLGVMNQEEVPIWILQHPHALELGAHSSCGLHANGCSCSGSYCMLIVAIEQSQCKKLRPAA